MSPRRDDNSQPPIKIDKESGIPIWLQLRNRLSVAIGVNYNTVGKVYRDIERDGYIISQRGRGTFVHDAYISNEETADQAADALIDEFIRQCLEMGIVRDDIPKLVRKRLGKFS